jgi:hypothetical protein
MVLIHSTDPDPNNIISILKDKYLKSSDKTKKSQLSSGFLDINLEIMLFQQ